MYLEGGGGGGAFMSYIQDGRASRNAKVFDLDQGEEGRGGEVTLLFST